MTSNDITINVETKNNRINKMTKLDSIHLEYLYYNILHLPAIIWQRTHSDDK